MKSREEIIDSLIKADNNKYFVAAEYKDDYAASGMRSIRADIAEQAMTEYADQFAVEFDKWKGEKGITIICGANGWYYYYDNKEYTTTDLLIIFKKERGIK